MKKVIGINGVSRCGKDSFCQILIDELKKNGLIGQRFALADALKNDLHEFVWDKFGVDIFEIEGETKELIRPLMLWYGGIKRKETQGTYWTSILEKEIENSDCDVAIITDLRYAHFEKDELWWVKEKMEAYLVNISRFVTKHGILKPANEDEAINIPKLSESSDLCFAWGDFPKGKESGYSAADHIIKSFIL